jgi:hypothetical protein
LAVVKALQKEKKRGRGKGKGKKTFLSFAHFL